MPDPWGRGAIGKDCHATLSNFENNKSRKDATGISVVRRGRVIQKTSRTRIRVLCRAMAAAAPGQSDVRVRTHNGKNEQPRFNRNRATMSVDLLLVNKDLTMPENDATFYRFSRTP